MRVGRPPRSRGLCAGSRPGRRVHPACRPTFGRPRSRRRSNREAGRWVRLHRRACLDLGRIGAPVHRRPRQHHLPVDRGGGSKPLHRPGVPGRPHRAPVGQPKRPDARRERTTHYRRARKSPHLSARGGWHTDHARRQLPRKTAEQPERRSLRFGRLAVFHRSALRAGGARGIAVAGARLQWHLPAGSRR